eukprot:4848416-Alexandrium_andersonii.AAC.1
MAGNQSLSEQESPAWGRISSFHEESPALACAGGARGVWLRLLRLSKPVRDARRGPPTGTD